MSLASHMVDQYERKPPIPHAGPSRPPYPVTPSFATPFGNRTMDPDASWMSGHGGYAPSNGSVGGFSRWSEEKIAALQVRLAKKLGPEYVTQRPGPGGGPKLSYIEGWKVINLANEVFGFNGWSSSIVSLTTDFHDVNKEGRSSCNVTAIIRITLADGSWHEDVGCGQSENIKGKGAALDKAKKEAVTDGTKRALRTFGNVLGNCLYDREYTKEVVKIKVPPPKFQHNELERRPEFTPAGAPGPSRSAVPPHMTANIPAPVTPAPIIQEPSRPDTPIKSIHDLDADACKDESFDGEFLDDSVLQEMDAQLPAAPQQPEYQHRHRPDLPQKSYQPSGAALRQAALLAAANTDTGSAEKESGSSGETVAEAPRRPVGGFNLGRSNAGSSARAQAISSLGPPRPSSPSIPDGGIDAVAARAQASYSARAAALGLTEEAMRENTVGFASARGMKRSISGEKSPTKPMYNDRSRQPLGEIGSEQEWAKRVKAD